MTRLVLLLAIGATVGLLAVPIVDGAQPIESSIAGALVVGVVALIAKVPTLERRCTELDNRIANLEKRT